MLEKGEPNNGKRAYLPFAYHRFEAGKREEEQEMICRRCFFDTKHIKKPENYVYLQGIS